MEPCLYLIIGKTTCNDCSLAHWPKLPQASTYMTPFTGLGMPHFKQQEIFCVTASDADQLLA